MKKVLFILILVCVNIMAMGQNEKSQKTLNEANAGNARSQYLVAGYYEYGRQGFEKDEKKALTWYTKAADQNYLSAVTRLATAYEWGKLGLAKNDEKYIYWLKKAADLGHNSSMTDLAVYYRDGKHGLKKDEKEFLRLAKKAADNDHANAMYALGSYYKGKNNKDEAIKWYKKCADVSYAKSGTAHSAAIRDLNQLGVNYNPAENVAKNIKTEKPKIVKVGDKVNIYYRSGQLYTTAKIEKKGSDYIVNIKDNECKIIPCKEAYNSLESDKDIVYYNKIVYLGVDLMIREQISGTAQTKSSANESSEDEDDDCAVKDGKVILYHRNGEVLQSAKIMEKDGKTHVKIDNGLYRLKACNKRFNGVTYNYSVFLFDTEYYVKGNIPGFKGGSATSSKATTKKSSKSKKSPKKSNVKDKVSKGVKKLKKHLN